MNTSLTDVCRQSCFITLKWMTIFLMADVDKVERKSTCTIPTSLPTKLEKFTQGIVLSWLGRLPTK